MPKKTLYGIVGIIVVLGLLLIVSQGYFNRVGSFTDNLDASSGQANPGKLGAPQVANPSLITEQKAQRYWPALIASAPPPRGAAKAPYQLVEIGDFECPQCGKLKPIVEALLNAGGGKMKLYFVNWPLTRIHPQAFGAAEAGEAAAAQGHFWPMYDLLYGDQSELLPGFIEGAARTIPGIDEPKLVADIDGHKYAGAVKAQAALVEAMGATATPTFLLRSPDGKITWYIGRTGTKTEGGFLALASKPPWGDGLSPSTIQNFLNTADSPAQ